MCKAQGKTIRKYIYVEVLGVSTNCISARTAQTQYHSTMGKRYPRSQAKEGDLLFWATNGDCTSKVVHTGIYIKPGLMINAAHTGTPVREESIWTSSGGEEICPDVVRFW